MLCYAVFVTVIVVATMVCITWVIIACLIVLQNVLKSGHCGGKDQLNKNLCVYVYTVYMYVCVFKC